MKCFLSACLLCFGLLANAQRKVPDTISINYVKNYKAHHPNPAQIYVDGKLIGAFETPMLNPEDLKDISVDKKNIGLNILTKNPGKHRFLTLTEIASKYLKLDQSSILFMINNDLVRDNEAYIIDEPYILSIQVYSASDFKQLKLNSPTVFNIVKIYLRTPENIKKASEIIIR